MCEAGLAILLVGMEELASGYSYNASSDKIWKASSLIPVSDVSKLTKFRQVLNITSRSTTRTQLKSDRRDKPGRCSIMELRTLCERS